MKKPYKIATRIFKMCMEQDLTLSRPHGYDTDKYLVISVSSLFLRISHGTITAPKKEKGRYELIAAAVLWYTGITIKYVGKNYYDKSPLLEFAIKQ